MVPSHNGVSIYTCTEDAPDRGLGLSPPGFEFCHFHLTGAVSVDLLSSNDRMYRSECVTPLSTSCAVKNIFVTHFFIVSLPFLNFPLFIIVIYEDNEFKAVVYPCLREC